MGVLMKKDQKITIVENEFYTAWCLPRFGLIHHQWHQYCYGDKLQNYLTMGAQAFEEYKCNKWLSDDRKFGGALHPDDWSWGEVHFTPRLIKAGWKYYAMVLPAGVIAGMSANALISFFAEKGVDTQLFTQLDEAQNWLNSKRKFRGGLANPEEEISPQI